MEKFSLILAVASSEAAAALQCMHSDRALARQPYSSACAQDSDIYGFQKVSPPSIILVWFEVFFHCRFTIDYLMQFHWMLTRKSKVLPKARNVR